MHYALVIKSGAGKKLVSDGNAFIASDNRNYKIRQRKPWNA